MLCAWERAEEMREREDDMGDIAVVMRLAKTRMA